jgi:hypothetical protein
VDAPEADDGRAGEEVPILVALTAVEPTVAVAVPAAAEAASAAAVTAVTQAARVILALNLQEP